ncbi:MAG: hypothetical protein EPN23_03085 [Verrucomicrobia bacterium]|nr:MAG: hypothetical protein EPN23_03085 [Verrucomicrobiota bacterium]
MKIRPPKKSTPQGSALLTVLVIMGILTIAIGGAGYGFLYVAQQQPNMVRKTSNLMHARTIAEAGANIAYAMLSTNFALKDTPSAFPATSYRGGVYDVSISSISTTSAILTSVGMYNASTSTVAMDVQNFTTNAPGNLPAATGAYANGVLSGGAMAWSGNSVVDVGSGTVQSNTKLTISGNGGINGNAASSGQIKLTGNATIQGNSTAPSYSLSGNAAIAGTKTTASVAPVTVPSIDLTPYYNAALANGQVYNTSQSYSGNYTLNPVGGILWVNGNLSFGGNGTINGCIIATGDITMSGNVTQSKYGNYPGLASQNGSITLSGNVSNHGLLYAKTGNVMVSGNVDFTGSMIAAGTYTVSGNFSAFVYENSTPVAPGGAVVNNVGISGWRQ